MALLKVGFYAKKEAANASFLWSTALYQALFKTEPAGYTCRPTRQSARG